MRNSLKYLQEISESISVFNYKVGDSEDINLQACLRIFEIIGEYNKKLSGDKLQPLKNVLSDFEDIRDKLEHSGLRKSLKQKLRILAPDIINFAKDDLYKIKEVIEKIIISEGQELPNVEGVINSNNIKKISKIFQSSNKTKDKLYFLALLLNDEQKLIHNQILNFKEPINQQNLLQEAVKKKKYRAASDPDKIIQKLQVINKEIIQKLELDFEIDLSQIKLSNDIDNIIKNCPDEEKRKNLKKCLTKYIKSVEDVYKQERKSIEKQRAEDPNLSFEKQKTELINEIEKLRHELSQYEYGSDQYNKKEEEYIEKYFANFHNLFPLNNNQEELIKILRCEHELNSSKEFEEIIDKLGLLLKPEEKTKVLRLVKYKKSHEISSLIELAFEEIKLLTSFCEDYVKSVDHEDKGQIFDKLLELFSKKSIHAFAIQKSFENLKTIIEELEKDPNFEERTSNIPCQFKS